MQLRSQPSNPHRSRSPARVGSLGRVLARVRHPRASRQPAADRIVDEEFNIPLPGKPLRAVGRARSWITRLALIGAPLVLIGGVAYSCGVSTGSARLVQPSTISADDASAFHLNSFPGGSGGGFRCLLPVVVLDAPGRRGHHRDR